MLLTWLLACGEGRCRANVSCAHPRAPFPIIGALSCIFASFTFDYWGEKEL
jgi:hypothetical protein